MKTLIDVFRSFPKPELHPETLIGPAKNFPRGFRTAILGGRDDGAMWVVSGRLRKRWRRIR